MSFAVGETVGDYQILGVLGQGGMGAVYRVRNLLSHREEAMKVALPYAGSDPQAAERFLREIRVQAGLRYPHIVELRTAVRTGDHVLMILELIEGESVGAKLKQGPLPFDVAFRVIDEILGALDYAHQHGVIHRDIKPGNIMVTAQGLSKLTDFGIARAATEDRITQTDVTVGSPQYMSPEQLRSNVVDERSDLYSLGVTFYEMLSGRLPVVGQTMYEILHAHMSITPTPLAHLVPSLPAGMSEVVMKSLAKTPAERYGSAQAFQAALRNALFGELPTTTMAAGRAHFPDSPIPPIPPPSAIPPAELERVERHLAAAMGPIARNLVAKTAPRHSSISSLCQDLVAQIPDPAHRSAFMRAVGIAPETKPATASPSPAAGPSSSGPGSGTRLTEKALEDARRALAEYLGPMAGVIVNRAAKRVGSCEELRDILAAEIPDEKSRAAFRKRFKA